MKDVALGERDILMKDVALGERGILMKDVGLGERGILMKDVALGERGILRRGLLYNKNTLSYKFSRVCLLFNINETKIIKNRIFYSFKIFVFLLTVYNYSLG